MLDNPTLTHTRLDVATVHEAEVVRGPVGAPISRHHHQWTRPDREKIEIERCHAESLLVCPPRRITLGALCRLDVSVSHRPSRFEELVAAIVVNHIGPKF